MHGDDFYMAFYYRLPTRGLHFSWQNHSTVMVGPGLEVLVHAGIDPILVFRNSYLAVIRGNRLCDSAKVRNGIVVDSANPNQLLKKPLTTCREGYPW